MKRILSALLAVLFALTAFGTGTLFGGVISAGAVYYDYYTFTELPGWLAFTDADLNELYHPGAELAQVAAPANAPERVERATSFTITNPKPGDWMGYVNVGSFTFVNPDDTANIQWCAKGTPSSGATLTGGYNFIEDSGISFWVGKNDGPYTEELLINIFTVPSKGTDYHGTDEAMLEAPMGFCFAAKKRPDEDGYLYFDFKTDFSQDDWFWKQDDGNNYSIYNGYGKRPLPDNIMSLISGLRVEFKGAELGDVYYIGDFCAYKDTRIHPDELAEAIEIFDAIDAEAYTEESYEEATEVYLRAYEMLLDDELQTKYTQRQVDLMARELIAAINGLKHLFPNRAKDVTLAGFGVWTDEDLETMSDLGPSLDAATTAAESIGPDGHAVEIIANGDSTYSEPYYGWSCFTNAVEEDGELTALKNPFGADMSETAGFGFWLRNPADEAPALMQLAVGKAGEARFVAEDTDITRPKEAGEEGYVYVSWSAFYDESGDAEIFDYLDNGLDFIEIQFDDFRQQSYFIADLHAFNWSIYNADLTSITRTLAETRSYMATLNPNDYTPHSWTNLEIAVGNAENLMSTYGVTQDEIDAAERQIVNRLNGLTLIGNGATLEELNYLYALINSGNNYWRGNYTSVSYNALRAALIEAEAATDSDVSSDRCKALTLALENAIAGLVPITHGSVIEKGFFSFEKYANRDLSSASGDRTENVSYSLAKRAAAPFLPDGFDQALKMQAMSDMSSGENDEHGVLQFKAMHREGGTHPAYIRPTTKDPLVGDLTGSDGILVWIGVNDVNLVSGGRFRIGVSNCEVLPLFEMHAIDIPIPPNGSGWIYVPWNYFDHYDEWTGGEPIRLDEIFFYIFRFDGEVRQGLEVYITGLQAYKDTAVTENVQPVISNVTEGETIDVSEGAFKPEWNAGNAILDGEFFTYGAGVELNGEHTLKVVNGDKQTEVRFTITGGVSVAATPIVSGVENGGEYDGPVTVAWDVGEGALNGEAVENGAEVSEPGEYVLRVTNEDKVTVVSFTIKAPEQPPVRKGDFNGNGKIEVDDALAALRIAARLAEATPEAIAIGDIDGNGAIEVNDALSILRVAAKLADESSLG